MEALNKIKQLIGLVEHGVERDRAGLENQLANITCHETKCAWSGQNFSCTHRCPILILPEGPSPCYCNSFGVK